MKVFFDNVLTFLFFWVEHRVVVVGNPIMQVVSVSQSKAMLITCRPVKGCVFDREAPLGYCLSLDLKCCVNLNCLCFLCSLVALVVTSVTVIPDRSRNRCPQVLRNISTMLSLLNFASPAILVKVNKS